MNKLEQLNAELATTCIEGLADLVRAMRTAQTEYFKSHDNGVLIESKSLERQVDAAVKKILLLARGGTDE